MAFNASALTVKIDEQLAAMESEVTPQRLGAIVGAIKGCKHNGAFTLPEAQAAMDEARFTAITKAVIRSPFETQVYDTAFSISYENAIGGELSCNTLERDVREVGKIADRYDRTMALKDALPK